MMGTKVSQAAGALIMESKQPKSNDEAAVKLKQADTESACRKKFVARSTVSSNVKKEP